jgi:hypothetical protein
MFASAINRPTSRVEDYCSLLRYGAAQLGVYLPTFRMNLMLPSSEKFKRSLLGLY